MVIFHICPHSRTDSKQWSKRLGCASWGDESVEVEREGWGSISNKCLLLGVGQKKQ